MDIRKWKNKDRLRSGQHSQVVTTVVVAANLTQGHARAWGDNKQRLLDIACRMMIAGYEMVGLGYYYVPAAVGPRPERYATYTSGGCDDCKT